ncbi:LOW QUALITY PROTEIN: hypothetical protein HID58_003703 [Brassica napus]|uniref:Serine-threonine/tyrosine-protein kinase catalytic domain-containing protein n=1 Tax=Brassica napus TaxID=3708 RepID=A0ABQ8ER52_BRANA|nr:LOW QUALITY PROTEIN: hypothetical protein HID58_003703 [Brassica napus]
MMRRDEFVDCARTGWNRKIRPEYGFDDEDYEDEHKEEEEEDRTWIFYLGSWRIKVSKRARGAVRLILHVSISTKLVGFSVNGVRILAFLWILKAFLEVACTLGTIVFTSILLKYNIFLMYLAPEYFMHGIVDEKTDVFAFGVLLLEIITGRRAVDTASRQSIAMWVMILKLCKSIFHFHLQSPVILM